MTDQSNANGIVPTDISLEVKRTIATQSRQTYINSRWEIELRLEIATDPRIGETNLVPQLKEQILQCAKWIKLYDEKIAAIDRQIMERNLIAEAASNNDNHPLLVDALNRINNKSGE